MAVKIASNIFSLNAQRRLGDATRLLSKVSEELSSGLRINRAVDDSAGLQIAEGLRADSDVYGQAVRNVNDGISLLNVTQGAVEQLSAIVTRQAELAEQAANGTYSYKQRTALNAEAAALTSEYNRIVQTTSFNGIKTLDGALSALKLQFGYGSTGGLTVGAGTSVGFAAGTGDFGVAGSANNTFATPEYGAYGSALVDVDGDNIIDLITLDSNTNAVTISRGNGDGTFKARTSASVGSAPQGLTVNDINNDGFADFVITNVSDFTFSILLGNGDGSFATARSIASNGSATSVTLVDVNKDGLLDMISADFNANTISFYQGNGNGTFKASVTYTVPNGKPRYVRFGDMNGDGKLDAVTADYNDASMGVLLGNGDGTFRADTSFTAGTRPTSVVLSDINADGKLDIISTDYMDSTVSVLIGNGDGSYLARLTFDTGANPGLLSGLVAADFDSDGKLDLLVNDSGANSISFLRGNGDGTFVARRSFLGGTGPWTMDVADINNDGVLDAVTANIAQNTSVFLGVADTTGRRNNKLEAIDLTSKYQAKLALTATRATLSRISLELGNLGAIQSRLSVASQNLLGARTNFQSARSQLVDADVALSAAELTRTKILQESATAVLAQANQQPSLALKLLRGTEETS